MLYNLCTLDGKIIEKNVTSRYIADEFGMEVDSVSKTARKGYRLNKKYYLIPVEENDASKVQQR